MRKTILYLKNEGMEITAVTINGPIVWVSVLTLSHHTGLTMKAF